MGNPAVKPSEEAAERHHEALKKFPNVLNVSAGADRIVVFVSKKLDKASLKEGEALPESIEGIPVDVVELSTKDFVLGRTSASEKSPRIQRRLAGGVRR